MLTYSKISRQYMEPLCWQLSLDLHKLNASLVLKKKGFNTQQTHIYNRIEESVSVQMIDIVFFNLTRITFPIMPVIKSVSYAALDCSRLLI